MQSVSGVMGAGGNVMNSFIPGAGGNEQMMANSMQAYGMNPFSTEGYNAALGAMGGMENNRKIM